MNSASYVLALIRPRATGTTGFDDIGDAVVGQEVAHPDRGGEQNATLAASRTVIRPNRRIAIVVESHLARVPGC
jgi:hypothetical protein